MHQYFITGSSKGLGKALAIACLDAGHLVTGISRTSSITHSFYTHVLADLSDPQVLNTWKFPEPVATCSMLILINNAATIGPVTPAGSMQNSEILSAYTLNLIAPAVLNNVFLKQFAPNLARKQIINISSGAGHNPVSGWSVYCSSKAGLDMFTRVAAMERESKENGLRIVSIAQVW